MRRDLPDEYPPWQTVYWYYRKWVKDGTWNNINRSLVACNRVVNDENFQPTVPIAQKRKVEIHEKRWIVERTISWTLNNRRCFKDYERKTESANAFIVLTNIRRLAKKI